MSSSVIDLRDLPLQASEPSVDSIEVRTAAVLGKTVADPMLSAVSREQYRQLAATLHNAQAENGLKAVMIASAVGGEGKTLTAANLALTFAESYRRRVLLVDADLRRPSLHRLFDICQPPTLAFGSSRSWTQQVRQVTPRLGLLTPTQPSTAPMADLTSTRMRELIQEARRMVDWIIVDTPPIALLPDARLLASVVDGTVIVVKAGSTPLELVRRAVDALDSKTTLGVVLNGACRQVLHADYGYDEYYTRIEPN
jgi:protein-tyrosine kinase